MQLPQVIDTEGQRGISDDEIAPSIAARYSLAYPRADANAIEAHMEVAVTSVELSQAATRFLSATDYPLTPARYSLIRLLFLATGQEMAPSEIARQLRITPGNVTQLVDGLERDGLVERTARQRTKRVTLTRLTPTGKAVASSLVEAMVSFMEQSCAELSLEEKHQLKALLAKFRSGLRSILARQTA